MYVGKKLMGSSELSALSEGPRLVHPPQGTTKPAPVVGSPQVGAPTPSTGTILVLGDTK